LTLPHLQATIRPMTPAVFQAILPTLKPEQVATILPVFEQTCRQFGIKTKLQIAAFLAQCAMESGSFRFLEEIASGEAYEGRAGNPQPGDGRKFKGRGWIQLTFRLNYRKAAKDLGLDLEGDPEQVSRYPTAALVSGWYWRKGSASGDLNRYADVGPQVVPPDSPLWASVAGGASNFQRKWGRSTQPTGFDLCTYGVNGGFNGKDARDAIYARALQHLPDTISGGGFFSSGGDFSTTGGSKLGFLDVALTLALAIAIKRRFFS
jgi:predicted chitinase